MSKRRPFIIDTSDNRCKYLYEQFLEEGYEAVEYTKNVININMFKSCILIFAPPKLITFDEVKELKQGSAVFGGNAQEEAKKFMSKNNISYFNILNDEVFVTKNAIPTSQGCLKLIIENSLKTFNEMKILILGYGRVAKVVAKDLKALGSDTYIYSIKKDELALAQIFEHKPIYDLTNLSKYDVIINTIPAKVIDDYSSISNGAFVCDLASGNVVDLSLLQKNGINAMIAPALPAKVCPHTAGKYMKESILYTLNHNSYLKSIYLVSKK